MAPLALTAVSFKYRLYSKLLSSADNKSQQVFLGCKYSHSVCQLTLSHIVFFFIYIYVTSQEALPRQQNLLASSAGLGIRSDVIGAAEVVKKDREIMVEQSFVSRSLLRLVLLWSKCPHSLSF